MLKIVTRFLLVLVAVGVVPLLMARESLADQTDLEQRVERLEKAVGGRTHGEKWYDRIQLSGAIEVEAVSAKTDHEEAGQEDESTSDVDLASVELAVDAVIADHVEGHFVLKYGDDEVDVDEGFITLTGTEAFPAYLIAGKQYIPFGYFDTHFISDPTTLVLGETNEGAVVVGYHIGDEGLDISIGAFNGKAGKTGEDDVVDSFVAGLSMNPVKGLTLGIYYTSNLAGADAFNEEVVDADNLESLVGGWSACVTYTFLDRFKVIGEYLAAMDPFSRGEIYDAGDTEERQPTAWNVELGVAVTETVELAARCGGSEDGGVFLPETEYGVVLNWGVLENTSLAVEYLHGEFENETQETETLIAQLAVSF